MPEDGIARLEGWMQAVLVHPGGAGAGVASREAARFVAPDRVEEVVVPTDRLTGVDRLGIYQEMYLLRMYDALESDYPVLARRLGERRFWKLVSDYVAAHPSRSYTLNRLGDRLPEFLGTWGPLRERGVLADLARIERGISTVFDAEEDRPLASRALARLDEATLELSRLVTVGPFALLEVRSKALELLDEEPLDPGPTLRRRRSWVLLYRRDFSVQRRALTPAAGRLLADLAAGRSVAEAIGRASRARRDAPPPGALGEWFREWTELGLFREIRPAGEIG